MVNAGGMARELGIQFEGAMYHVTVRGFDRRMIFGDPEARQRFVRRMTGGFV